MKGVFISVLSAVLFLSVSCGATRRLPQGQYLLSHAEVKIEKERDIPRHERITDEEAESYMRHTPRRRFLGAGLYALADPEKDNGFNRWLRRTGSAPVLLDSALIQADAVRIRDYVHSRGFRSGDVDYGIDIKGRRAKVVYDVTQGSPYRIGSVSYRFRDSLLAPVVMADSARTLLRPGDLYDMEALQDERRRIASHLNAEGYYAVSVNNIRYEADTLSLPREVGLTLVVTRHIAGYDQQALPVYEDNTLYRIGKINVDTDHDPASPLPADTLSRDGVNFIYRGELKIKPEALLRAIGFRPGELYSSGKAARASDKMVGLDYFRNVNILFSEGGEDADGVRLLVCDIICTPGEKHDIGIETEATTTSDYWGLSATIGYHDRNIFRGAELFDASLTGGYEFMHERTRKNSTEAGATMSLTFPQFFTPFPVDREGRADNARSRVEFSINTQNRPYYNRLLLSAAAGYGWDNGRYSSFTFNPLNVGIIKLRSIDEAFLASLENPYLLNSYRSQFILGMSGSYLFNNQARGEGRNTFRIRANGETGGNLLDLVSHLTADKPASGYYRIFDIQYSQYARADLDISYRMFIGRRTSLVYRLYAGLAIPYGNSESVPFERLFYAGGPTGMRGWASRTLGPGATPRREGGYPSQLGNFKLEANAEFRFPVSGIFNGALFADAGNIWMVGQGADAASEFRPGTFYEQLGLAGGLGLRLDLSLFLFRMDWGLRLHDPGKPYGERWIDRLTMRQGAFNFGIGYPF